MCLESGYQSNSPESDTLGPAGEPNAHFSAAELQQARALIHGRSCHELGQLVQSFQRVEARVGMDRYTRVLAVMVNQELWAREQHD